ncbi:MAG: signal peptidase I [Erysipelotrichales bacterium]|nr:signal peptidase I [Erysipelotrichales bacterium]
MYKYIMQLCTILLTISLLFFNIYFIKSASYGITILVLFGCLIISRLISGYRRPDKRDFIYKEILIIGLAFLIQSVLYLISSKSGFNTNFSSMFKNYISKTTIFSVFLIVFIREIIRYIVVNIETRRKISKVLINLLLLILCVLVDLSVATKIYTFTSFTLVYDFIALFLIPSVAKNILLNYLSVTNGFVLTFSYVLIMDLYIYFMPVTPNLNTLLEAVTLLVFPYVVYAMYNSFTARRVLIEKKELKKENKLVNTLSIIIFGILVCLVSREFKYSMIGIGSGSMTGTINKGDAIIYRRYEGNENLKDKVIVFRKSNVLIVHRVIKSYVLDNGTIYQTKGDYNDSPDSWVVTDEDIVGVVEKRVPFIAWPSVILSEIF